MLDECAVPISGSCAPEFDRVRDAFESNFTDHEDIGAAVAVWVEGNLVVNLCGGFADAAGAAALARKHLGEHLFRLQGADQHLRASAGRPR